MLSSFFKTPRGIVYFVCITGLLFIIAPKTAVCQPPSATEATAKESETAERIRVLEAQRLRVDERTSLWGGTGLVFTRTAVLIPRKHLGISAYYDFKSYDKLQGWNVGTGRPQLDDPRQEDHELNIVLDYGLTHYIELSGFVNVFLQDEQGDSEQLHMRERAMGQSGVNAKFRLMDIDRYGLGITTTLFGRFPSPQKDSDTTSRNAGYGGELNVSLKLITISELLEKFRVHANFGWAYIDYFDTGLAGFYQDAKENFAYYSDPARASWTYRGDYTFAELIGDATTPDELENEHPFMIEDHYTGSVALEYRPVRGMSTGIELVGYRMIKFSDDNLQFAPFLTYTFRQIPFIKQVRKNLVTFSVAGNFGFLRGENRTSPEWGVVSGLTWHTDLIF